MKPSDLRLLYLRTLINQPEETILPEIEQMLLDIRDILKQGSEEEKTVIAMLNVLDEHR